MKNNTKLFIEKHPDFQSMIAMNFIAWEDEYGKNIYIDVAGYCGFGFWTGTPHSQVCAYRMWEWSFISFSRVHQGFPVRPVISKKNIK